MLVVPDLDSEVTIYTASGETSEEAPLKACYTRVSVGLSICRYIYPKYFEPLIPYMPWRLRYTVNQHHSTQAEHMLFDCLFV